MPNSNKTKTETLPPSSKTKHISTIPPEILRTCMEYIGKGSFIFIAVVSKQFCDCYADLYPGRETSPAGFVSDSLQCVKKCYRHVNERFTINAIIWAARKGQASIVEHAINHRWISRGDHRYIFAYHGEEIGRHLNVLKLIHKHRFQCRWKHYCIGAIKSRNKELIAWMANDNALNRPLPYDTSFGDAVLYHIAQQNDLDLFNWVREQGYEWISRAFYNAVCWGSADMLDYCIVHNLPVDEDKDYCSLAAKHGKLENLKWLRNHSFLWKNTCYYAARRGHLDILKWARSKGCPWDRTTYQSALRLRHRNPAKANEIIAYLESSGCPM